MGDVPDDCELVLDHGEFHLAVEGEEQVIALAMQNAAGNMNSGKPGQFWQRLKASIDNDGDQHELCRIYHVDLLNARLVISETYDGNETARRTLTLPSTPPA